MAKSFHEARQFIPVDESKITPTLEWIMSNQSDSGSFHEPPNGRVIHTDMQVRPNCHVYDVAKLLNVGTRQPGIVHAKDRLNYRSISMIPNWTSLKYSEFT